MCRIIIHYLYHHVRDIIFMVILLFVVFYMSNIVVNEYIRNDIERKYLDTIDDTLFMSFEKHKNSLMLDESRGDEIGYVKLSIPRNDKTENSNACWMVSEFYYRHFLSQVVKGKGIDYGSSEKQVILYGSALIEENNIGDTLSLNGVPYTVVGCIPEEQPIFNLHSYSYDTVKDLPDLSESPDCLLYPYNDDMYLVNDCSAWEQYSDLLFGCIMEQAGTGDSAQDWIAMKDIKKQAYRVLALRSRFSGTYIVLLAVITVFVLVSLSLLQFITFPNDKAVYLLCGMSSFRYYFMQFYLWLIILVSAGMLNFLVLILVGGFSFQPKYLTYSLKLMGIQMVFTLFLQFVIEVIQYKKLLVRALKDEFS